MLFSMLEAVALQGVTHEYPKGRRSDAGRKLALEEVSLTLPQGTILGLLGPNGAGKTTLVKIISTLLMPTKGTVRVFGQDALADPRSVRRRLGLVLGGDRGLYDRLSARDNLRYFAELYGLGGKAGRRRIAEVLDIVGLASEAGKLVERFSRGMRQRLHIARGILHEPELLLLDEPTIGVDPVGARELRTLIRRLCDAGTSILLTTHYMYEAEQLAHSLTIVAGGRVVVRGTPEQVRSSARVQLVVEGVATGLSPAEQEKLRTHAAAVAVDVQEFDGRQRVTVGLPGAEPAADLVGLLENLGLRHITQREASLEDVYVELVTTAR